ncbi:MAG: ATP-binding cassette domain-containing protein [Candidatus Spechtbacteria bacterium]|nr:ATP-binding cassette domain-containing protein [Candidatus Spechtbacteria bacterium]
MVLFQEVSKIYPNEDPALDNVTLRIEDREFVSLVGRSGAGKSTLLRILLREEHPTNGRVFFKGVDVFSLRGREVPGYRRRIGVVFQEFKLLPSKTVFENIAFAMEAAGKSDAEIFEDVPQALALVDLQGKENRFPQELSGGEKQRVSLARALVQRPEIILADEPTGNLDPIHTWEIIKLLVKINELGTSVILATHDKEIVDALGRRVVTLENGRITRDVKKGKYKI